MHTYTTVDTRTHINYNSDLSGLIWIGDNSLELTYSELSQFINKMEVDKLLCQLEDVMDDPDNRTIEKIAILKNCVKELQRKDL